ncbi:uncharacterized protein LOC116020023 isoform X2 [Ipomoea triloba]|uniref:uncharacterized protein LOC116020023 isoform X2 n=1 Tax=Ipomoea triloba TaxID=35885 RepID=UPI00125DC192|nr:uncharacterized protein LOC116020023 isoform X2 [Ipomoea triloba]
MSVCISTLLARYMDSCKRHGVPTNPAVLSGLYKSMEQKRTHQECTIVLSLDDLEDDDLSPLIDFFQEVHSFDIDAVDILCRLPRVLNQELVLALMHAVGSKLRTANLQDILLKEDIAQDIFEGGLNCQLLKLRFTEIRKLNMAGSFAQLHTLNLDFCSSLTGLEKDCFACLPKLMRLSMCGTRIADLWTTTAALLRLPSLIELRFQNCVGCEDTGICLAPSNGPGHPLSTGNLLPISEYLSLPKQPSVQSGDRDLVHIEGIMPLDLSSVSHSGAEILEPEISLSELHIKERNESPPTHLKLRDASFFSKMYASHHPSPICFEKHYREYMIVLLPRLEVLDNVPIQKNDREMAKTVYSNHFEYLPCKRTFKESVLSILHMRETRTKNLYCKTPSRVKRSASFGKSQISYSRSLCAAKFGASSCPSMHLMSHISDFINKGRKVPQPRQFEYHPSDPGLMSCGTLDGEVIIVNHEKGNVFTYIPPFGMSSSVLGLCWLNKHPSKLLVGCDNGSLRLYDINHVMAEAEGIYCSSGPVTFEKFEHLTSVHVNSTDDRFLTSGYTKKVAIFDICSGRRLHTFSDMHSEPINVAKFANHSPNMLVTSSFDHHVKMWDLRQQPIRPCYTASSSRGNVMVCFSPDDLYLLVSAIDNEVKQILAVDGRLHTDFGITSTGSAHNYTRSYYMNGRDYIISGSCDESVVRICCAQTGKRLKDLYLEDNDFGGSILVQSLRSDPFRHFHMAVLAAYPHPNSKRDIIKVNLVESC